MAQYDETISKTFTSRPLDDEGKSMFDKSNMLFTRIEELLATLPNGRLKSLALTEIEKASLVVNKAISRKNDVA